MKLKKCLAVLIVLVLLLNCILISVTAFTPLNDFTYEISNGCITLIKYNGKSADVIIPDTYAVNSVAYPVSIIGNNAFEESNISSIKLSENLKEIGESAFYDCNNLTSVIIPETVDSIGLYAFDDCNNLTDVVILNPDVSIGESAFGYYYAGRKYHIVENFILRGFENSTAQEYAIANEIDFEIYVKPVLGDINTDKSLNIKDLVRLKKILAGSISSIDSSADINGDGIYSAEDLVCIRILLIYGEENLKTHTVIFKDADGNVINTQSVLHSFAAVAPEAPIKENYIFTGWSADFKNVMKDMVITAEYISNREPMFSVEKVAAKAGDSFVTVAVSVKNNPGILGMTLSLEYDENVMTLTDAANGTALSGILNFTKANILKSGCNFIWDGQEISSADIKDGSVLLLTFKVSDNAANGTYPINISYEYGDIIDTNLNSLVFVINNGNITVS